MRYVTTADMDRQEVSLPLATRRLQLVPTQLDTRAGLIGLALLLADRIFAPDRVERLLTQTEPAT